jgi:hypothetical protein
MITRNGSKKALNVTYEDRLITCESNYFGSYKLKRDTITPNIKAMNIGSSTSRTSLSWKISDDGSGLKDYDLFINDNWHLVEYEYKTNQLTFKCEKSLKGTMKLKLRVIDNCGNTNTWNKTVEFK